MSLYMIKKILFILLIFLIIIAISLKIYDKKHISGIFSKEIPKAIYQTWHTKNLPPHMKQCVNRLKAQNPDYKHYLYDDKDCREFIKKNFSSNVLNAFDNLIPGAYKADLWRYCILYVNGGIYLDIKYDIKNGFSFNELSPYKEYFVLERPGFWENNSYGIYNALMICHPKNPVLLKCINKIAENVENKYYGINALYPTGPGLLGNMYFKKPIKNSAIQEFEILYGKNNNDSDVILHKNKIIFMNYDQYRNEQKQNSINEHYDSLWKKRQIYK